MGKLEKRVEDEMNQKEKDDFDALMRIADFNIKQFNERRDYSWKIAFGFWGAIIGSIAVISPYRDSVSLWVLIPFGVLVVIIHTLWLSGVFHADQKDKKLAFEMRNRAIKMLNLKPPKDESDRGFLQDWSAQFQFEVTFFLVVIAIAVIVLPG
jgi:hypothetical protein